MNYLVIVGRNVTAALLTGSKCEGFQEVLCI